MPHRPLSPVRLASLCALALAAVASCQCDDQLSEVPGSLEGRACNPETGGGLPGAVVEARGPSKKKVAADAEGRFIITGLAPGAYTVVALLDNGDEHPLGGSIAVAGGETLPVIDTACSDDPDVPGGGRVDGQVCNRHTGSLISDATVDIFLANGEHVFAQTDGEGRFAVDDVPAGSHVLSIRATSFQRSFPITIVEGETFTLDLADGCESPSSTSGAVAGEFCDPGTNGALAGADVTVHRNGSDASEDIHELTDTDGRFFVAGLVPGAYTVDVEKEGVPPVTALVDIVSGATATVVGPAECASRAPVGRIAGQICDADAGGRFVGQVELLQGSTTVATVASDAEGNFTFNVVSPGTYDVRAFRVDYERFFRGVVVQAFQTTFVQESNCPAPEDQCEDFTHQPDEVSDGRILFVLDRSGSMAFEFPSGGAKIDALRNAVQQVTTSLASTVTYGLFAYPNPANDGPTANCATGAQQQSMGANAAAIGQSLNVLVPGGGTPTAATVRAARDIVAGLVTDGRPIAVVLATDGAPNCATNTPTLTPCTCTSNVNGQNNDACATFNCIDDDNSATAIAGIAQLGVKTHVIGIRGIDEAAFDVDADGTPDFVEALNKMAIAGQAPRNDPLDPLKFHEATSTDQLAAALAAITRRIVACQITVDVDLRTSSSVVVKLGDEVLPQDITRRDGWNFTGPSTIELYGAACDAATFATNTSVVVTHCTAAN